MHAVRVNLLDWNLTVDGHDSCVDPEGFVRGDPTLTTFVFKVDDRREDPSPTSSGPSSARQRNAIKWRFPGMPMNAQHWMLASQLRFFSGSGHVLLENPIFCDFSGGRRSRPGSAHVISWYYCTYNVRQRLRRACASVHSQYSIDGQASPLLCWMD